MNRFRQCVLRHFWWLGMIVAGSLLAVHSLGVRVITVDTASLFLVGLLLLCPWLAALKRIKIGNFEAEIDPAEVKRLTFGKPFRNSSAKSLLRCWGHLPREKP